MSNRHSIQINLRVLEERKRAQALELYRQGKASKSKAAEIAGISLWEMMGLIEQERVPNPYTLEEAVEDVRQLVAVAEHPQVRATSPRRQRAS